MDSIDSYTIKGKYDYNELLEIVENKLMETTQSYVKVQLKLLILCVVGIGLLSLFTVSGSIGGIIYNLAAYFGAVMLIFGLVGLYDTFRKLKRAVAYYKSDLARVRAKLELNEIYVTIPDDIVNKYNDLFFLIIECAKRMKKKT